MAARHRAREDGREYTLDPDFELKLRAVEGQPCPACTRPMVRRTPTAPSMDRVLNEHGYTPENVEILCRSCNRSKGNLTSEDLFRLATWLRTAEAQAEFAVVDSTAKVG